MGKREAILTTTDARREPGRPRPETSDRGRSGSHAKRIVACIAGTVALGFASALLSPRDAWYAELRKPAWMPPGWLFGVVWTLLYSTMGLSLALVFDRGWRSAGVRAATAIFLGQLALNLAWSPVFFRYHSSGAALVIILALWLTVGWTIAAFWSIRDVAGALLLPYWAWVTFATALNAAIWRMN